MLFHDAVLLAVEGMGAKLNATLSLARLAFYCLPPLLAVHAPAHSTPPGRSRILIDPVKQLFAAWLFVLGRWGFLFAGHSSWVASESGRQIAELNGRCGALLPLFRLVGVRCIAALRRVEKPTASPQGSPELNSLALGRPQMPVQVSAPVRRGESLTGAKCWAVRFLRGRAAQHL